MEDFTIVKKLAQGGQGATMLAKRSSGGDTMVLKQCKCENLKEANAALKEAKTLQRLKHRSIVEYHDVFLAEEGQYLIICTVMEYCAGGDLAIYMNNCRHKNQQIPEHTVLHWVSDIMAGLHYLHKDNIVHRDMKPLNVFLTSPSRGSLKIGDFGLASTSKSEKQTSKVGTPCYLSPEILQNDTYGPPVDVWGAGCIMLEMMTFAFLWERKGMLSVQVLSRPVTYDDIPGGHSHAAKDVAISMLEREPQDRPSASQVFKKCRALLERTPNGEQEQEAGGGRLGLGGLGGHLAQGIEAIWRAGSAGSGSAVQQEVPAKAEHKAQHDGSNLRHRHQQGDGGKGSLGSNPAARVADFRRKTPAQAGRRPEANTGPALEASGPSPQHAGAPRADQAPQPKAADLASRRATPLNVKRALRKRNLERYTRLVEEQELYGDVLLVITDSELEKECGVHDAGDRLALLDVFRNLVAHGPAHFDKSPGDAAPTVAQQRPPPPHGPAASPTKPKGARTEAAGDAGAVEADDHDRRSVEQGSGLRSERHRQARPSEVRVWLDKIGMGKYGAAFEANGLKDLHSVADLEVAELKALGVRGRRENPYGPEETTSDLDLVLEALRGLRTALGAQAQAQGPGAAGGGPSRRRGSFNARVVEESEEERLFQQALQESLAEYESSTSASGSAPSSRNTNTGSNPGTASSFSAAPMTQEDDGSAVGSGGGGERRGGKLKDRDRGGKKHGGTLIGLGKVRGLLDVSALSQPGKGAVRAYCVLKGNRLKLWWGNDVRDESMDPPSKEIVMDGKCVDAMQEAGRISSKSLFIRRSMFAVAHDDLQLTVLAESTFVEWLQRLQASAYLFSMGAPSVRSPVTAIVLRVLTITNASALFQDMSLAVVEAKQTGEVIETVAQLRLAAPTGKDMRFEVYKEVRAPEDANHFIYFEVRHSKNGRPQPTKYWASVACQDMEQGDRVLQVYKAPVEYNIQRQRLQPKKESTLEITFTA